MEGINIELTRWQTEMLSPLFSKAREAEGTGEPIGIFAQVWEGRDDRELGFLEVRLANGDMCQAIQKATGVKVGKTGGKKVKVFIPMD